MFQVLEKMFVVERGPKCHKNIPYLPLGIYEFSLSGCTFCFFNFRKKFLTFLKKDFDLPQFEKQLLVNHKEHSSGIIIETSFQKGVGWVNITD